MKRRTRMLMLLGLSLSSAVVAADSPIASLTVNDAPKERYLTLDATIEPVMAATVSAQTSGRILSINYDVNDRVPANASLLRITSTEQGASLAAAEAEYARALALNTDAQAQLKRYSELFPQGAISKGDMDRITAQAKSAQGAVKAAKAQVEKARESVAYTQVYAPFSGIVTQRHVEIGEAVAPGQALLSGYSLDQMRAVLMVPQQYLRALKNNPQIEIALDDGRRFELNDFQVFNFASGVGHNFEVRVPFPDKTRDLAPSTMAKASFVIDKRPMVLIPQSALYTQNELSAVYLKQGDDFLLTQVRVGEKQGDQVVILAGLKAGDEIALNAYDALLKQRTP
ncbi:MAG: efflux RND transporter periplasmic adaptor subunit [Shewanella sp.]|nr:efflux RND transporter periplasmic adaptor subunit [Shewanella sp.]MCF1437545.1 efflux RND transporter periplasmic adaptor subunit [Shewanella sp.]MCF1456589.1 efflux RND transporter periplasmic adaptor subunit [Shewanella sp.]